MKLKEWLLRALRLYTLLVTLITLALLVLGSLLDRDRLFSYEVFVSPLFYALIGTAAGLVTETDREVSVRELIIRKMISLALIEGIVLLIACNVKSIPSDRPWVIPGIALSILVIYLLANLFSWLAERREAIRLSKALVRYQHDRENGAA